MDNRLAVAMSSRARMPEDVDVGEALQATPVAAGDRDDERPVATAVRAPRPAGRARSPSRHPRREAKPGAATSGRAPAQDEPAAGAPYDGPERRHDERGALVQLLASVLDEVDYGLVLIAADGRVVHANHAARLQLGATQAMRLADQRLVCRSGANQRALDAALSGARDSGRRRMLTFEGHDAAAPGRACDVSIVPLPSSLDGAPGGHAVLASLARARIAQTLSVDAWARELRLSPREQQVLAGMCDGLRVKEIAARLEIGEETVRSHVKRLKFKTGCADRFDMVSQVSRLPPMLGSLRQGATADAGDD